MTRDNVLSEITELEALLASIPEDNVIERMSLEARLKAAQSTLAALPTHEAPKATLTFRGKPVVGSHGISADFGTRAAGVFSDAFTAIAAALSEGLRPVGPIPNRERHQLLITGTAIGSFGFEFELPDLPPSLLPGPDHAEQAMARIEDLFRLAAEGSDDDMAEVIEEVHPRAVKKVHEFLDLLVQHQAWCGLEFGGRHFRFTGHDQIKASCARLKDDNIHERQETFHGEFQGVLPAGRSFEFRCAAEDAGLIRGKVDVAISDPDALNRNWLHKPVRVTLNVIQVGQGRPRYTLMSLDDLKP